MADGNKYYQYTAVDGCTRLCFREMYDKHSTYSPLDFLKKLIEFFPFPIRTVRSSVSIGSTGLASLGALANVRLGRRTQANKKSNNISKICLKYRTPNAVLQDYLGAM